MKTIISFKTLCLVEYHVHVENKCMCIDHSYRAIHFGRLNHSLSGLKTSILRERKHFQTCTRDASRGCRQKVSVFLSAVLFFSFYRFTVALQRP